MDSFNSQELAQKLRAESVFNRQTFLNATIGIAILITAHVVIAFLSKLVVRVLSYRKGQTDAEQRQRTLAFSMLGNAVYWVGMLIVLLVMPAVVGIETTALIAVLGSVLFAIGLGLQGTLSDLAVGVMLLGAGMFSIGEYIEIPEVGLSGTVHSFNILYTVIVDEDTGIKVSVPNRKIYENAIQNYTTSKNHVDVLEVVISNNNKNIQHILDRLRTKVQAFPRVINQEGFTVTCNVSKITEFGTTIEIRVGLTLQDYQVQGTTSRQTEIMTMVRQELDDMGVELVNLSSPQSAVTMARQSRGLF